MTHFEPDFMAYSFHLEVKIQKYGDAAEGEDGPDEQEQRCHHIEGVRFEGLHSLISVLSAQDQKHCHNEEGSDQKLGIDRLNAEEAERFLQFLETEDLDKVAVKRGKVPGNQFAKQGQCL